MDTQKNNMILRLLLGMLLMICQAIPMSSQDKKDESTKEQNRFEIAGSTFYSTGMFASHVIGEVSFGYKINKYVGFDITGLASNLYGSQKSWGTALSVNAYPKVDDRLAIIPSLGLGVVGGSLNTQNYKAMFAAGIGVEARFMVYENFYCGFESKLISAGKGLETFLFGIKFAVNL